VFESKTVRAITIKKSKRRGEEEVVKKKRRVREVRNPRWRGRKRK
jgi:hypothetical protein